MLRSSVGMCRERPSRIVPHGSWWRPGAPLLHIPTRLDDEGLAIFAPDELAELLGALS